MLEHDRTDVSEGIDFNKTNILCRCVSYHYCYFLKINFKFQPNVWDVCYD